MGVNSGAAVVVAAAVDAVPTSADAGSCTYHSRTGCNLGTHARCRCKELPPFYRGRIPSFDLDPADTGAIAFSFVARQRMSS